MKKRFPPAAVVMLGAGLLGWLSFVRADSPVIELADVTSSTVGSPDDENIRSEGASSPATSRQFPPLFVQWPRPQVAIVLTGRQHGYIEPCGCSGLENQLGGLNRRYGLLEKLRSDGWPVVALDVGNQVRRFGRQAELKFQTTVDILRLMHYQGIGLGPDDLHLSFGEIVAAVAASDGGDSEFVCANVDLLEMNAKYRVVSKVGVKIGITAVLGTEYLKGLNSDEITTTSPAAGLSAVWPKLQEAKCDYYVLLAHTSLDESRTLARKFPQFQFVVSAGGAGEPPLEAEVIPGRSGWMVQVGTKGKYAVVIGLYPNEKVPYRYQRVPLDDRFPDSRLVMDAFGVYQQQLKGLGLDGLGLRPLRHPSGREFVGSEACSDCHMSAYEVFEETAHASSLDALVNPPNKRSEVPRHHDPECISCHVVGWNPQEFFPYVSGYLDFEKSKSLYHTGCEDCHGPGSAHVAYESGDQEASDAVLDENRKLVRLTLKQAPNKCMECHDLDNSPDFHADGAFEEYWKKVEHHGMD